LKPLNRKALFIPVALLIAVIALILAFRSQLDYDLTVHDPSYHFTFCKISQGTNHVIYLGNPILAFLNRTLLNHGHRPITRDTSISWQNSADTTCVTVLVRVEGDDKIIGGASWPSGPIPLNAEIITTGGYSMRFHDENGGYPIFSPRAWERRYCWLTSPPITNLSGCELRITQSINDRLIASFKFH
jgi:hypothetical protein